MDKIKLQPLLTDSPNQSRAFSGWRLIALCVLALALPGVGLGIWLILLGYQKLAGQRSKGIAQIVGGVVLIIATGALLIR